MAKFTQPCSIGITANVHCNGARMDILTQLGAAQIASQPRLPEIELRHETACLDGCTAAKIPSAGGKDMARTVDSYRGYAGAVRPVSCIAVYVGGIDQRRRTGGTGIYL